MLSERLIAQKFNLKTKFQIYQKAVITLLFGVSTAHSIIGDHKHQLNYINRPEAD